VSTLVLRLKDAEFYLDQCIWRTQQRESAEKCRLQDV